MTPKSTPTRVLILSTAYLPQVGGSELAIKNITDRLPGIFFDLITSRPPVGGLKKLPEYERLGNVNAYRVGGGLGLLSFLLPKNFLPIAIFFKACQLIRKHGSYNVIHAYQASQAAGGGWLLKWRYPDIPFLVTVQEGKILNQQSWLMRFFRYLIFRKADEVTVISNYLAQYVKSQNPKMTVRVIPNGVDLKQFPISNPKSPVGDLGSPLRDFQFPNKDNKRNTIITVSRLVEKNGIGDLIEAMVMVRNEIQDVKLIIIGDGLLRENLKFKVKNLKLENNVEFLGEVLPDKIPQYLSEADIFVRPSLSEGLGTAFLEAMAAGLPIIGTSVGGIPDFLKDPSTHSGQATGLFCKVADPNDLAEKIVKLLQDNELRTRLADNGRKLVEEKYDWNIVADKFSKLYGNFI